MFLPLNRFDDRYGKKGQTADELTGQLMGAFGQIQEAFVLVLSPPPVRGIGQAGGFKMQVEDRSGQATPQQLEAVTAQLANDARQDQRLTSIYSSFRANVPQLWANVDRTKAKKENVAVTDIFQTLQVYLGSFYINDFNYLGRTFRVVARADAPFRARAADVAQLKTRNLAGDMVPLGTVMDLKDIADADRINRYNLYPSAEINGAGVPGVSSGTALEIMSNLAAKDLPAGFTYEWTELAYQEETAGNTALLIFPLCVLFVFLTHSAEYESFALSSAIIMIVPMCLALRHRRRLDARDGQQHLYPDRLRGARGHEREERRADRRVRQAAAGAQSGDESRRGGHRGSAAPAAADPHDQLCVHLRRSAAADGTWCRRRDAARPRHRGLLRDDRRHILRRLLHPVFYAVIRKLLGDKPIRMPGSRREKPAELTHA